MTSNELREKFLNFFKKKGHAIIPSSPLTPEHDPTVLFTTAGMHPLVPYLLGQPHPLGRRLADSQKCIRTTDIDDVGDNRHLTFFEMLGNWSLGDYFKKEAIEWSWEFLTDKKYLGLDPNRLYVTVFMGDENAPIDQESIDAWKIQFFKAGINAQVCDYNAPIGGNENFRIFPLPAKDNWWGPAGQTGPCGPCSEIFYDVAPEKGALQKTFDEEVEPGRIMEIWNDVFMEFNKTENSKFEKLSQQNVDTGMGLERTTSVLNGKRDTFDNELFYPLFEIIGKLTGKKYGESPEIMRAMRIVADHIKAATFILAEGLEPSNVERGYVLRRLIRRVVRYGKLLGINEIFTFKVANVVIEMYREVYPELHENHAFIEEQLVREEEKFVITLDKGLKLIEKVKENELTGKLIFDFYQTYGFPYEMTKEYFEDRGYWRDEMKLREQFNSELLRHQELSRAGAEHKFKGGLADRSEQTTKYHTAAHMLLAALRQILGEHVFQKGSNITAERLRLDFSHPDKLTLEQVRRAEDLVNQKIEEDLQIKIEEMTLEEAKAQGAMGVFESRYGEKVKVYTISEGDKIFSKEICGGPHVEQTGALGKFEIVKEESSGAGIRRIRAVLK
jgi:alanyl-tRNA synthetase